MNWSDTEDHGATTVEVTMPETGAADGAAVLTWLKQPGDEVELGEPICLVAWDESRAEVTSPAAGVVRMLALAAGSRARTGGSLAIVDVATQAPERGAPTRASSVPESLLRPAPVREPDPSDLGGFHSPAVRRFAAEHDVDPETIAGSGRDGRVTLDDLRRH